MKVTVKIVTTFWPRIWQCQKWSTKFPKYVAYNSLCYHQPETDVQRSPHFVNRVFMVSICGSQRISNKDYIIRFSLSSEQTGSVILLVPCIVTTIYTHQHHIKTVSTFCIITTALIYVSQFTFSIVYVKLRVFVLSACVLCLPENRDLSTKHVGDFLCIDSGGLYINVLTYLLTYLHTYLPH
jgi:hypothetical protein